MKNDPFSSDYKTLVIDDHEISRRYTVAALRETTATVKHTHSASEALELAIHWYPDLIILDLHLPEMNGLALAHRISCGWPANHPQPRFIVLSGDLIDECELKLEGLIIDRVLLKPVSAERLRSAAQPEHNRSVRECREPRDMKLIALFRKELEKRVPELDQCISEFDMQGVMTILHQLIASSAICGEPVLEASLRSLDRACRTQNSRQVLATAYCDCVNELRGYLQAVE